VVRISSRVDRPIHVRLSVFPSDYAQSDCSAWKLHLYRRGVYRYDISFSESFKTFFWRGDRGNELHCTWKPTLTVWVAITIFDNNANESSSTIIYWSKSSLCRLRLRQSRRQHRQNQRSHQPVLSLDLSLYTIMISVKSLQRSKGDVSKPIKYICIFLIWSRIYSLYGVGDDSVTALQTSDWNHYTLCKGIYGSVPNPFFMFTSGGYPSRSSLTVSSKILKILWPDNILSISSYLVNRKTGTN